MRDAESTLDQLISFCGDKIEEADVLSMFGLAAESQILKLSKAVLDGEIQTALTQLNELAQGGKDLGRLLGDLLNHFRNLLIYQISRGDLNLLEVSEAEIAALKEQSPLAGSDALTRILETLANAELNLRDAASRKILVEVTLLKAIEARNSMPIDAVLKQLNQLRGGGSAVASTSSASAPAAPAARPATKAHQAIATPPVLHESQPVSGELSDLWVKLIDSVGRVSPFTRSYLVDAHPVSFDKNVLVIGFDPEFEDHLGLVDNARNHTLLQTKLAELGRPNCQIKFIKADAPAIRIEIPRTAPREETQETAPALPARSVPGEKEKAPTAFNKNDFKNDPLIQKALEIFKGQIVEVRA
jgi:DNA polymerase III gamma/tau subunit